MRWSNNWQLLASWDIGRARGTFDQGGAGGAGSILDDPDYLRVIEDQGGLVVTDSTCFGSRIMWKDVREEGGDPIQALAQYYVADRHSCPRTFGEHERRAEFVREMIREFNVDGVIGERLSFCDQWGFAQYSIKNDFEEDGVPYLPLEREYILDMLEQTQWHQSSAAEALGISRRTLYRKLKRYREQGILPEPPHVALRRRECLARRWSPRTLPQSHGA